MSVKLWTVVDGCEALAEWGRGEYVEYGDYQRLESANRQLREALESLSNRVSCTCAFPSEDCCAVAKAIALLEATK
jgi:hypothetical protein